MPPVRGVSFWSHTPWALTGQDQPFTMPYKSLL